MAPQNNHRYEDATDKVAQLLLRYWPSPPVGARVDIHTWTQDDFGLRVSEITLHTGSAGKSFMQSDVYSAAAVLFAERAIIEVFASMQVENLDRDATTELRAAMWRVIFGVHGEEAANLYAGDIHRSENL